MVAPRFAAFPSLILVAALGAALSANTPTPQTPRATEPASSRQARKDLGEEGYTDLMQAFHAGRYAVNEEPKVAELGGKKGLVAYSRKQNVRAIFAKDGIRVQVAGQGKSHPTVRLTPIALQRGAKSQPLPATRDLKRGLDEAAT